MPSKRKVFKLLEDRPAYKNAMALFAFVAALSALIGGAHSLLTRKPPEVVHDNTELIVDRSQRMGDSWEGTTRLRVAESAARSVVGTIADGENLALRQFGGPCQASNTRLIVPFAQGNAERVRSQLDKLKPAGDAPLNRALNEAIGDFGDQKRFEGANKRILVITGSDDTCQAPELREAIREKLAAAASGSYKIRLDFRFVGIGLTPEQQQNLKELAVTTGGQANFADHPAEVEPLLRTVLHAAANRAQPQPPVGPSVPQSSSAQAPPETAQPTESEKATVRLNKKELVETLAAGVGNLNTALDSIRNGDFEAARRAIMAAQSATSRSSRLIPSESAGREQFPELRAASARCFDLYQKLLNQAAEMISLYEKKDVYSYQKSASEFERMGKEFNRTKQQVIDLSARM